MSGSSLTLSAYHLLPGWARNWAASLRGYSLRKWRYSPETATLIEKALEREHWSAKQWQAWQEQRLVGILERTARMAPFYRQAWEERRRRGDASACESLKNWPVLKKETVRSHSGMFLADDCRKRRMYAEHTSGTTGTPLALWRRRETVHALYALSEARTLRWNNIDREHPWGHVGGQPVVPFAQSRPPFWVWNSALKQLYLSSMHIGPHSSSYYLKAIKHYGLSYLLGYSHSLASLAQAAAEDGVGLDLKLVLTDSEPLLDYQRSLIRSAFNCPVRETYGMAEMVCMASECPAGHLHLWPEVGYLELLDENDLPVPPGGIGRIVATSLLDSDMPLIRYDTGDLAELNPDMDPCACGRSLPRFRKLFGRNDDVIITTDGRRLVQIDRIFDPCYDIREAQIIQEDFGLFRIKVVPGRNWKSADGLALCEALRRLVGEASVRVDLVSDIEKTWAGKHRIIISRVRDPRPSQPAKGLGAF